MGLADIIEGLIKDWEKWRQRSAQALAKKIAEHEDTPSHVDQRKSVHLRDTSGYREVREPTVYEKYGTSHVAGQEVEREHGLEK